MSFDWQTFLDRQGIEYTTRGPSTARGNYYLPCPFCGQADQGRHMGISLNGKGWGCWRDASHRGIAPIRLVQALLQCSWEEAARITQSKKQIGIPTNGFMATLREKLGYQSAEEERTPLQLPKHFRRMGGNYYRDYLRNRGFSTDDIFWLTDQFGLRASSDNEWAWRIIIPVYSLENQLITWTARATTKASIRYKTLSPHPEKTAEPPALAPITDCLLRGPEINQGGEFLVITEGPMDCMRTALNIIDFGAQTTCLFGKNISAAQLDQLALIRPYYHGMFLLLDPEEQTSTMRLGRMLESLRIDTFQLSGDADPGDMTNVQIQRILERMETRLSQGRK